MLEINRNEIVRMILRTGESLSAFASRSRLSLKTLRKIFRGSVKALSMQTINKIANALNVPPESLLKGD